MCGPWVLDSGPWVVVFCLKDRRIVIKNNLTNNKSTHLSGVLCCVTGEVTNSIAVYCSMALVDGNNLDWIICNIPFIRGKTVFTRIEWSKLIINGSRTQCDHVLTVNSNGRERDVVSYFADYILYTTCTVPSFMFISYFFHFFSCVFYAICIVDGSWTSERRGTVPMWGD